MDTEKALIIIKNATAVYKGTLQEHNQIQTAIAVIENQVNKKEAKKDSKK